MDTPRHAPGFSLFFLLTVAAGCLGSCAGGGTLGAGALLFLIAVMVTRDSVREALGPWRPLVVVLFVGMLLVGCGDAQTADAMGGQGAQAAGVPACDPALVGGDFKCTQTPANDQPSDFVLCSTYPYTLDGTYQGSAPVSGCTLDFVARPGVPYTALCVDACPVGAE
jgi:hypothetical protein